LITSFALYEHSCATSDAVERLETLKPPLRPAKEEGEEQWRDPFPEREMAELTAFPLKGRPTAERRLHMMSE
jgi:hypothetical protein